MRSASRLAWMEQGACLEADPELFHPVDSRPEGSEPAKKICASCPVVQDCHDWALSHSESQGVWGGLSEAERRTINRRQARREAVEEFTSSLSSYARRHYGGQVSTADLLRAVGLGWTPKELARHCSRELPTANAWRVIQSRLEWCATNPPKTTTERRTMKPHDCERHPDRHVCPWLNETDTDGAAVRCGCADEQRPAGRPA